MVRRRRSNVMKRTTKACRGDLDAEEVVTAKL
jgi:hypothetical protein